MKHKRQEGFILIIVILLLAVISLEMYVLSQASNTLFFESKMAYSTAARRNLAASGLAWVKHNLANQTTPQKGKTVELDISDMSVRNAKLQVTILDTPGTETQARITTSFTSGEKTFTRTETYQVITEE